MRPSFGALALLLAGCASTNEADANDADAWPLVYSEDFASGASLEEFSFSDQRAWRWSAPTTGVSGALELAGQSSYKPKHRSPHCIALLRGRSQEP